MFDECITVIVIMNFFLLIILIVSIKRWQKRNGKIGEKKMAILLSGYFSFTTITSTAPLYSINIQLTILVNIIFLIGFWGIGYPWIRWLYRKFDNIK
jgi:hypothetical protein